MDIAFHRSPSDIEEDLEYYFSDQRDKHNQIRPSDDIRSFTPDSATFTEDPGEKEIGNLFYPFTPYSLDRIFIGISFPLFSNNWGAAFLRHLLGLIKPNGAVILPVYPEVQARDQGLWCRSSLENIFRSRSRFIGTSNIWAENDGVMSMRVGRRWPPVIPSTARWLFEQAPLRAAALGLSEDATAVHEFWQQQIRRFWRLAQYHAIIEQILRDRHGARRPIRLGIVGVDSGVLALECLMSLYLRVTRAYAAKFHENAEALQNLNQACATRNHGELTRLDQINSIGSLDALCITEPDATGLELALRQLNANGTVVLTPECAKLGAELSPGLSEPEYYSDKVARRLHNTMPIYHYSTRIEQEIADQTKTHQGAFTVLFKN